MRKHGLNTWLFLSLSLSRPSKYCFFLFGARKMVAVAVPEVVFSSTRCRRINSGKDFQQNLLFIPVRSDHGCEISNRQFAWMPMEFWLLATAVDFGISLNFAIFSLSHFLYILHFGGFPFQRIVNLLMHPQQNSYLFCMTRKRSPLVNYELGNISRNIFTNQVRRIRNEFRIWVEICVEFTFSSLTATNFLHYHSFHLQWLSIAFITWNPLISMLQYR